AADVYLATPHHLSLDHARLVAVLPPCCSPSGCAGSGTLPASATFGSSSLKQSRRTGSPVRGSMAKSRSANSSACSSSLARISSIFPPTKINHEETDSHRFFLQSFRASQRDMNGSSERWHGVQALACRLGPLENGSHKLKLELHALFQSFRASQRDMKAPLEMVWISVIMRSVGIIELDRLMAELQGFSLRHQ